MTEPLRILLLTANPSDSQRLKLETEYRLLRNMMHDNAEAGNCELRVECAARAQELCSALMTFKPHIVHFAGHGDSGGICLENNEGRSQLMSKEQLTSIFTLALKHLRLVVLNACSSAPQTEKLGQLVDYMVTTNAPLADAAALRFTANFYQSLAFGGTVREAFHQAQGKLAEGIDKDKAEQYELSVRQGADESKPLLPPFTNNSVEAELDETRARKAVFANVVVKGHGASSSPVERPTNERNVLEVKSKRLTADELYVVNRLTETD